MAKSTLENAINEAATKFAAEIVEAVKASSLQELIALQKAETPKRRGRKPGPKPKATEKKKPGRPKKVEKKKPGRPPKKVEVKATKKKRVVKNYPKCAFPGCDKNRFPRGKGFCGDHYKEFQAGKIKAAEEYKK